jgi:two-component system, sporulation sensor kinase E
VIQDITDINQKDDLIAEQNAKLKDIAWYQSHITRAPLARIMGLVALLEDDNIDENEITFLHKEILGSSHELDKVIHDIVGKTNL